MNLVIPKYKNAIKYEVTERGLVVTFNTNRVELILANRNLAQHLSDLGVCVDEKTGEIVKVVEATQEKHDVVVDEVIETVQPTNDAEPTVENHDVVEAPRPRKRREPKTV